MSTSSSYACVGYYNDDFINNMGWSLQDMKSGVDKLIQTGFTGIDFDLSVPYDNKGNLLSLKYQNLSGLLKYCQDKGIQTSIHLNSVLNYDNAAYIGSYGHALSTKDISNFFMSMEKFFNLYGSIFESSGVDIISIGGSNQDVMGSAFHDYWAGAIKTLKNDFHGLVTYQADSIKKGVKSSTLEDIGIWDLLDAATVWVKPYISEVPISDYLEILQGYYFDKNHQSILDELSSFVEKNHLPLILQFNAHSLNNALDGGWDPTPTQVATGNSATNNAQQSLAYQAFFDFIANHLGSNLSANLMALQIANFSLAPDNSPLGIFGMSNFPEPATTQLIQFLKDKSNYNPSHVVQGGPGNDRIFLSSGSNVALLNGGFDNVVGSTANDIIIFSPEITFAEVTGDISAWIDSQAIEFSIQVKENGKLVDTIKLGSDQVAGESVNTWVNFSNIHFKLPTNVVPKELEISLATNTGTGFISTSNFKIYWLGDKPLELTTATQIGNNVSALASTNPSWIVAGGGKRIDISSLNLSFNNSGITQIDGKAGTDTVKYTGDSSNYTISKPLNSGQFSVNDKRLEGNGLSSLQNIERIQFADLTLAMDLTGNAGTVAKILGAVFGKTTVTNKAYVGIGLDLLDKGMSYDTLAGLALNAAKATTNDQIVTTLWTNVVGSAPSAADKAPFIKMLEDGMTPGALAHMAAETSYNTANINLVGLMQTGLEFLPFSG